MSSPQRAVPCGGDTSTTTTVDGATDGVVDGVGKRVRFARTRAKVRRFIRREHEPLSLRHLIVKSVLTAITMPICFVGSLSFAWILGVPMTVQTPQHDRPAESGHDAAIMRLVERHDCWMGPAPKDMEGKTPGHAVVTWPGDKKPTYGGTRAVDAGLSHVFEDKYPLLRVHAFCR